MNELQIFTYNGNEVRTVQHNGETWWVLKDVCEVLGIKNTTDVTKRLDNDEVTRFNLGSLSGETNIVNESGLYNVILRSDKPEAKPFRKWVTSEVLPSIRKHGAYMTPGKAKIVGMTEYQQMMANTRVENIKIRKAQMLERLADQYDGTYKQILHAHATKELTGEYLLPLPQLKEKTYSATEIGDILGISSNKVGVLTNRYNLKSEKYGAWFNDKAKGHNKEVQTFRYYENVIPVLQELIKTIA
ncbi:hypothetical protein IMSAG049_00047 [Clostridiales bacterium]|nr:hypothetical protein IMSAG049_00047 [Clostridiales bacterium]